MGINKLNREQINAEKRRRIARNGSIIVHALIFCMILFMSMKPVETPLEDSGILINFGKSDKGSGNVQPKKDLPKPKPKPKPIVKKVKPKPKPIPKPIPKVVKPVAIPKPVYTPPKIKQAIEKPVATQNVVKTEVSAIPKAVVKKVVKPIEKIIEKPIIKKEIVKPIESTERNPDIPLYEPKIEPVVKQVERTKLNLEEVEEEKTELVYDSKPNEIKTIEREKTFAEKFFSKDAKNNNDNNSEGRFENTDGDQGNIEGVDKPGNIYKNKNTGLGNESVSYGLDGRTMINTISINDNSQDVGIIVIRIKVDKFGNVISAEYTAKGSTSQSSRLIAKAKEASFQAKFNSNPLAPEIQFSTISFDFRYR